MTVIVLDQYVEDQILAERKKSGADRFDEVWDGVYIMAPLANTEHQDLGFRLAMAFSQVVGPELKNTVFVGVNVSDREEDWTQNYRCPDVAVFLPGTKAKNCGAHWFGGPDLAVEILSPGDRGRDKFDFYARIGVREVLVIAREPWSLELHRLRGTKFRLVGESPAALDSKVLPVSLELAGAKPRPEIEITHQDGRTWRV